MSQEVPEIPLSIGSKLELLLRAFVFAKSPFTSPYTPAFVRMRVCILPCITIYIVHVYYTSYCIYNVHYIHDRGAEGFAL